jgi:hypothetical protein
MITDLFLNIFTWIISAIANILPIWQVWPQAFLNGLGYFANTFKSLNFIVPVAGWFDAFLFFTGFCAVWIVVKIIRLVFNR